MQASHLVRRLSGATAFTALVAVLAMSGVSTTSTSVVDATKERRTDFGPGRTTPMTAKERAGLRQDLLFINSLHGDVMNHEDELAARGIYIVSDSVDLTLSATNSDMITMKNPFVTYNTQQARYFVNASYQWKTSADYEYFDSPCSSADDPCNVGGTDGFGVRFNRNVTNLGVEAVFCGRNDLDRDWADFGCATPTNPEDNSSAGVSYRKQDKVYTTVVKPDNNMYSGTIAMGFTGLPCGKTLQMYGRYGHSWGSTALTGFSVSTGGFGLSWSNEDNHWAASSQAGSFTRC